MLGTSVLSGSNSTVRKRSASILTVPLRDSSNTFKSFKLKTPVIPESSEDSVTVRPVAESAQSINQLAAAGSVSDTPSLVLPQASEIEKPTIKNSVCSTFGTADSVNNSAESSLPDLSPLPSTPAGVPVLKINDDHSHVDADVLISQPERGGLKDPHPRVRPQPALLSEKWAPIGHTVLITVRIKSLNGIQALVDPRLANVHFEDVHTFPLKIHTKTPLKALNARITRALGTPPALRGAIHHPDGRITFTPFLREEMFAEWLQERHKSGYVGVVDCWPLKPRSQV